MQRIVSAVVTAILIFVMIALPVSTTQAEQVTPGGRVVGGAEYHYAGVNRLVQFAISQEKDMNASGLFQYSDEYGEWYRVEVSQAKIHENQAYIAGEVISASRPEWVGLWFSGALVDTGEQSNRRDRFSGAFGTQSQAQFAVSNEVNPTDFIFIEQGNIIVYSP